MSEHQAPLFAQASAVALTGIGLISLPLFLTSVVEDAAVGAYGGDPWAWVGVGLSSGMMLVGLYLFVKVHVPHIRGGEQS